MGGEGIEDVARGEAVGEGLYGLNGLDYCCVASSNGVFESSRVSYGHHSLSIMVASFIAPYVFERFCPLLLKNFLRF